MFNKKILSNQIKKLTDYPINFEIDNQNEDTTINIYKDFKLINSIEIPSNDQKYSNFSLNIPKTSENDYLSNATSAYISDSRIYYNDGSLIYLSEKNLVARELKHINYIYLRYSGCCVPYYALVNTPNGSIEARYIKNGDIVYGYDFNENKVIETEVIKAVTDSRDHIVKITLEDESIIEITDNHTVWTNEGWACLAPENCDDFGLDPKDNIAIQLKLDQECLCINNELKKITNIEFIPHIPNIKVCMFSTECENYFTQNYLVHNLDISVSHGGGSN